MISGLMNLIQMKCTLKKKKKLNEYFFYEWGITWKQKSRRRYYAQKRTPEQRPRKLR